VGAIGKKERKSHQISDKSKKRAFKKSHLLVEVLSLVRNAPSNQRLVTLGTTFSIDGLKALKRKGMMMILKRMLTGG